MNKKRVYLAKGLVLGHLWGGGIGAYPTIGFEANSMVDLMGMVSVSFYSGSIDSGMGFESLIGAVMDITVKTYVEIDDEVFVSEKYYFDSVGNLTNEQYEWLQGELLFKNS